MLLYTSSAHTWPYNIFHYVKRNLTQNEIDEILSKKWISDKNYDFPAKIFIADKDKTKYIWSFSLNGTLAILGYYILLLTMEHNVNFVGNWN